MTKEEFLRSLAAELRLTVSEGVIENQVRYYSDYIQGELVRGRSEEDVIRELGDPRLLARTITDAAEAAGDAVALETPFRYTEADINYNSDAEDRQYQGAQEDSGRSRETSWSFGERTHNDGSAQQETSADGQTVENNSRSYDRQPQDSRIHVFAPGSTGCFITGLVLILVFWILMEIIGGIFVVFSPILMPVIVVAAILWIAYSIMNKN